MAEKKINLDALDETAESAELKATAKPKAKQFKDILIKKVSVEIYNILRENGHTFGGFAKIAIQEKMKRDGLL